MVTAKGVHLLPANGEFVYDTIPWVGAQRGLSALKPFGPMNTFAGQAPTTDYTIALDQLQAEHPD